MDDKRLPFLRGSMDVTEPFRSPRGGATTATLPPRDRAGHQQYLLSQLDALRADVNSRPAGTRDVDATRELIAVHPAQGFELAQSSLGDKKSDVRVVGEDPSTKMVLLDAAGAHLPALERKIREYSNPKKASPSGKARHESLVAPIERIHLAELGEIADADVLDAAHDVKQWLELGCRGGIYARGQATRSRYEVERQLGRIDDRIRIVAEFHATTQTVFYVKVSLNQLTALIGAVDCIYETHLAERKVRDWLILDHDNVDLSEVRVDPACPRGTPIPPPPR